MATKMSQHLLGRAWPYEAQVAAAGRYRRAGHQRPDIQTRPMHVELLIAKSVGDASVRMANDLRSQHISIERRRPLPVAYRDHAVIKLDPCLSHDRTVLWQIGRPMSAPRQDRAVRVMSGRVRVGAERSTCGRHPGQAQGDRTALSPDRQRTPVPPRPPDSATAHQRVQRLDSAQRVGRLDAALDQLCRISLPVCDEVGYRPFEPEAAAMYFAPVANRYNAPERSCSATSRSGCWPRPSTTPSRVAVTVDRLVLQTEIINLNG